MHIWCIALFTFAEKKEKIFSKAKVPEVWMLGIIHRKRVYKEMEKRML